MKKDDELLSTIIDYNNPPGGTRRHVRFGILLAFQKENIMELNIDSAIIKFLFKDRVCLENQSHKIKMPN